MPNVARAPISAAMSGSHSCTCPSMRFYVFRWSGILSQQQQTGAWGVGLGARGLGLGRTPGPQALKPSRPPLERRRPERVAAVDVAGRKTLAQPASALLGRAMREALWRHAAFRQAIVADCGRRLQAF